MDYDAIRKAAANKVILDVQDHVNEDGIVALEDLSNTTKNFFKGQSERLGINKSEFEVDFVAKHTGYLLFVRKYNLADKLYKEAVSRGYLVNGELNIKEYLNQRQGESDQEYLRRHAKYIKWARSLDDYMGQEHITRQQFFDKYIDNVSIVDKFPKIFVSESQVNKYISTFADSNGCIDGLKQNNKYAALVKWCKRRVKGTDFEFLTPVQSMQKYINENTRYHFTNELYVPECKLDVHTYHEYVDTKNRLIEYAQGRNITNLRVGDKELYNMVRHIKDIVGYVTIKDCIDTMLYDEGIKYMPAGQAPKPVKFDDRYNIIAGRIKQLYVEGKAPHQIRYKGTLLDISGINKVSRATYMQAQRAYRQYNFDNGIELTFSEFMRDVFSCYYPTYTRSTPALKTNNVYKKAIISPITFVAVTPANIAKLDVTKLK